MEVDPHSVGARKPSIFLREVRHRVRLLARFEVASLVPQHRDLGRGRGDSDDANQEELRKRVKDAQESYRGTSRENNTDGGNESAALPPTPPRDANRENGSAFEEPPAQKIARPKTASLKTIPEAWKKRGLRGNPEGNSWVLPLRLDLRGESIRKN